MSLNRVKLNKSKIVTVANTKDKKLKSLHFLVKKLKDDKLAILEDLQENNKVCQNIEKDLRLEIANLRDVQTKHTNVVEALKDKTECPVCMEIPRKGPIFVCPNGHFVCKKCKTGSCPTCREDMGNGKSLLAVTVIENVDHKCKFDECEETFDLDKVEAHEKVCKHRIVQCPSVCYKEVALSQLLQHLQTCSNNPVPHAIDMSVKSGTASFRWTDPERLSAFAVRWKVFTFLYRGTHFSVSAEKLGDYYHFSLKMFETEEVCTKYKIEMEVHERDCSRQDSEFSSVFKGRPCSVDQNKEDVRHIGLSVHKILMEKIIKKSKDFAFTVFFSFSEKRIREAD